MPWSAWCRPWPRAADGSGIINVAIFGGAVVPLATGALADATGSLGAAMILPALCYAVILGYGLYAPCSADDLADERATELTEGTISPAGTH